MKKRRISEELIDIWSMMLGERIDQAKKEQMETGQINRYIGLGAYIDGMAYAVALLSSLEEGRFKKDYERLRKEMTEDG